MISDLFIIGGGINGCGIARDAAGRGLSVTLAEMGDLAQATSSASTKLFHGGLRYLEYFEVGLVRKALQERETLLRAMPHIARPMRFVLPLAPGMRFDATTPTSKLLGWTMPWLKGRRPDALIRLGLFLYDHLGGRKLLPGTEKLDLTRDEAGAVLKPGFTAAYEYSDVWVDDARLVVLNARDAALRGATILSRTKVLSARREAGLWLVETTAGTHRAKALVNAAGPWARLVIDTLGVTTRESVRLVRGSHIVVPRLFAHERSYFFQGEDGRIIFAIPYERDFTLIGTTDQDHAGDPAHPRCTEAEQDYLCAFASRYFARPVTRDQVVWSYSGVRPLYNDGASAAQAATRDYVLSLDSEGAPLLSVFGGKITTYRRLAEGALEKLAPHFPQAEGDWTAGVPLPGGDFPVDDVAPLQSRLQTDYPYLSEPWAARLIRSYGTEAWAVLGDAKRPDDLGRCFAARLTEREILWLREREWAQTAEDVLWRRSKLGLHMSPEERAEVAEFIGA